MFDLTDLGFGPFFGYQLTSEKDIPARITAEHRGGYEIRTEASSAAARLAGRLAHTLEAETFPAVGDWVVLGDPVEKGRIAVINRVLERRTAFVRAAAGSTSRGQTVAANVDVAFIVCGLDSDYNVHRIERYVSRVWASGAHPVVVLSKADLCDRTPRRVAEVKAACPGVSVLAVSVLFEEGAEAIRTFLGRGMTGALMGSSGAGKSTLVNALLGEERMNVGAVRNRDERGCHTTTHRQLFCLPTQGMIVDTPGMRELHLLDEDGIDTVFSDIDALSKQCRFRDCSHHSEPGCAVRAAIETGILSIDRLDHFQQLETEASAFALRRDERRRRQTERAVGRQRNRDAALLKRWKKGR